MSGRAGFTLMELLVVLAILALTAAVAAPAFTQLGETDELAESATEMKRLLERARMSALERGTATTVVIDPDGARYRITAEQGSDSTIEGPLSVSPTVKFGGTARRPKVTFTARGTANGDDIVLTAGGRAQTVRVDPWTGRIHVAGR